MDRKDYAIIALSIVSVTLAALLVGTLATRNAIEPNRLLPTSLAIAATSVPLSTATQLPAPTPPVSANQPVLPPANTAQSPVAMQAIPPLPATAFVETFAGSPAQPQPWTPTDWDITVHTRGIASAFEQPMQASHGPDCGAPPATHPVKNFSDAVFECKDHLMTSIYATDYGMIYLTPNRMIDFSSGEAVVRFDLSTLRTSQRDWIDLWVTPYDDNLQLPLNDYFPDGNGEPHRGLQIKMDSFEGQSIFRGQVFRNYQAEPLKGIDWIGYDQFLTPDAKRRDTFELRISRTHIKFGMPAYNFWWVDAEIADLGWSSGVVQFGHHSYNPQKDCDKPCSPNTWHWDNIAMAPVQPFTIIRGDHPIVDQANAETPIRFAAPAPVNAHLRFTGVKDKLEASFDDGKTWDAAQMQQQKKSDASHFQSYWMPIPAGTSSVRFRDTGDHQDDWMIRDTSIWAPQP